jgi:hypothetical protein
LLRLPALAEARLLGNGRKFQYEDGGVTEILQSIFIPPKTQAPFSLTLHTEWVKTLSDGNTITLVNQRHISRDSQGGASFRNAVTWYQRTEKWNHAFI